MLYFSKKQNSALYFSSCLSKTAQSYFSKFEQNFVLYFPSCLSGKKQRNYISQKSFLLNKFQSFKLNNAKKTFSVYFPKDDFFFLNLVTKKSQ